MSSKFESSEKWIVLLDDGSEQPEVHCEFTKKAHNSDEERYILLYEGNTTVTKNDSIK